MANTPFIVPQVIYPEFDEKEPNKVIAIRDEILRLLNMSNEMFKWTGLPDTIPEDKLELFLQSAGVGAFIEFNDKVYFQTGGLAPADGEPPMTAYYDPTGIIVVNPNLDLNKNYNTNEFSDKQEAVLVKNDTNMQGLIPSYHKYATRLVENEITLFTADINARDVHIFEAQDNKTFKAAQEYQKDIRKGKDAVILSQSFGEGLKTHEATGTQYNLIATLLQYNQFLKTDIYAQIGLSSLTNPFKKEAISSAESQGNNDTLMPTPENMLKQRQHACDLYNKLFGEKYGEIKVELKTSWNYNKIEAEMVETQEEMMEKSIDEEDKIEESQDEDTDTEVKEEEVDET